MTGVMDVVTQGLLIGAGALGVAVLVGVAGVVWKGRGERRHRRISRARRARHASYDLFGGHKSASGDGPQAQCGQKEL
jgi:hypothetical protein